ncbi:MAG: arginase [Thiobacillaceae bacterium]|jgi:arginase
MAFDLNHAGRRCRVLGAASGLGFTDHGCALAPDRLRQAGSKLLLSAGGTLDWEGIIRVSDTVDGTPLGAVSRFNHRLAQRVDTVAQDSNLLTVIGGDHSIAPGTWAGVRHALGGPLGLIWIDAHPDAQTPETTHTGNIHGMPLAALLGQGPGQLIDVLGDVPIVNPAHVIVIGVRAVEPEEMALLSKLGVRVVEMGKVVQRGLASVLMEAVEIVTRGTAGFGISLDMDVIDPSAAPGVNKPVPGGILADGLIEVLRVVRRDVRLKAVEIVEFNPSLDRDGRTLHLLLNLLAALVSDVD